MANPPDITSALLNLLIDTKQDSATIARAQLVLSLSSITLLIDKRVITIPEAIERIELLRGVWLRESDSPGAKVLIQTAIDWLRQFDKKPAHGWKPVVLQGGRQDDQQSDQ